MRRKTTEQYKQEVFNVFGDEYQILEEYKNQKTKLLVKHKSCGKTYLVYPDNLIRGHGCWDCFKHSKLNKDKRISISKVNSYVEVNKSDFDITELYYKNGSLRIKIKHLKCGNVSDMNYQNFKNSCGCSYCADEQRRKARTKNTEKFKLEVFNLVGDEYTVLGEYKGCHTKVNVLHNLCGNSYSVQATHLLNNRGCPYCARSNSKACRKIEKFFKSKEITYVREFRIGDCRKNKPLPFDFAVFDKNILVMLIEFDGEQHYRSLKHWGGEKALKKRLEYDRIKDDYCIANKIKLLRINFKQENEIENLLIKELSN